MSFIFVLDSWCPAGKTSQREGGDFITPFKYGGEILQFVSEEPPKRAFRGKAAPWLQKEEKKEVVSPPQCDVPPPPKKKQRRDWKAPIKGEQIAAPGLLMFRAPERDAPLLSAQKRSYTLEERVFWAEKEGAASINIAGVRNLRPINGHFFMYLRLEGETMKKWRGRLRRMRRGVNWAESLEKEQARADKPLWQQIEELSQRAGIKQKSRFTAAIKKNRTRVVLLGSECSIEALGTCAETGYVWPRRIKTMRTKVQGVKTGFSPFEQEGLARKLSRALLLSIWREQQQKRRERMRRVFMHFDNHRVVSLRASLEKLAETCIKQQIKDQLPKGEGPCCSKPVQGVEVASEAFDNSWEPGKFDDLPIVFPPEEPQDVRPLCRIINVRREDYQGYGPHDFHWAPYQTYPTGQMEVEGADAQGSTSASTEQKSTVELQTQVGASIASALPAVSKSNVFSDYANAESKVSDETFHDRWYTLKQLEWNNQAEGSEILRMSLPNEFLQNAGFLQSPSGVGFKQHMYWTGTIKIKIVANTNVRQYGQLQFSFYYGAEQDSNFEDLRTNIYSASQRLHSLLTANLSNDVIIDIPFEFIMPVMVVNRPQTKTSLGLLLGKVIVPLTAASNCPKTASIKVLISLQNSKFSGMVGTAIARPRAEMFSALTSIVAMKAMLDQNRDAPSLITPGTPVVPINSSSWCMGNGQSTYNNVLRLNPNQLLPYPEGRVPPIDEMTVDHIASHFGMVKILPWTAQGTVGQLLWSFDAAPVWKLSEYPQIQHLSFSTSVLPPVAVMSSLYCYWRGSLELRIDVVGATELSGSLLIAYVPRVQKEEILTMEQCFSCAHTIYDIHENRQIIFKIPFVAPTMFHPRRYNIHEDSPPFLPPGTVYMFVYNKLIVNCTIPDNCKLVCYLRGGSDFEVAVPAAPSIGLGFQPEVYVPPETDKLILNRSGYVMGFSGSWRYGFVSTQDITQMVSLIDDLFGLKLDPIGDLPFTVYVPQIRYGSVSDHVTQFRVQNFRVQKDYIYIGKFNKSLAKGNFLYLDSKGTNTFNSKNFIQIGGDGTYIYGTAISDEMRAKLTEAIVHKFNITWVGRLTTPGAAFWLATFYAAHCTGDWNVFKLDKFTLYDSDYWEPQTCKAQLQLPADPKGQGDERTNVEAPVGSPQASAASSASADLLGERFMSLKDLCRRFQLYAYGRDKVDIRNVREWRTVTLRFPVLPQGLQLDIGSENSVREYWNRTRDGPIPIVASGFRFFTGGIRLRVCLSMSRDNNSTAATYVHSKVFVQHRPNLIPINEQVVVSYGSTLGTDDLELPGYAAYHQTDDVNSIISVEIPFYMSSIRTYLQRANLNDRFGKSFSNLGECIIGITLSDYAKLTLNYDIYYSLADDARFSVFVGFPPMIECTQIPDKILTNQSSQALDFDLLEDALKETEDEKELPQGQMSSSAWKLNGFCLWNLNHDNQNRMHIHFRFKNDNLRLNHRLGRVASLWNLNIPDFVEHSRNFYITDYQFVGYEPVFPAAEIPIWSISKLVMSSNKFNNKMIEDSNVFYNRNFPVGEGWRDLLMTKTEQAKVTDVLDKAQAITDAINPDEIKETTSSLSEITAKVKECLSGALPSMETVELKFQKYFSVITCAISQIVHCILNFNLKTFIVAIISFLVQLKVVCFSAINQLVESMGKVVEKLGWCSGKPKLELPTGNMSLGDDTSTEDGVISGYISSLVAGVAALFSMIPKFCKARYSEIADVIFNGLGRFAFTANHLFTFIKNNLVGIKRIGEYLFSSHPSMHKIAFLKDSEKPVHEWAEQVIMVTDPRKENEVFTSVALASQVYRLAYQAGILNIKMLDLKLNSSQTQTIMYLIKKINDLRDRLSKAHMAPPVKFEPYILELYGKTGIGKSQLLTHLPYVMFKRNRFTHDGELIYHRALGNAYWNNLRNQPVLVVDEKFPVEGETFLAVQLAELFQLKSSCVFNPPMADIPDKNIRYNPLIALYASNNPFPDLAGVLDKVAIFRRRDALVQVAITPKIASRLGPDGEYKQMTKEERGREDKFEYLRFRFHKDVKRASLDESMFEDWIDYQKFEDQICERFSVYYAEEERKYRKNIAKLTSVQPEVGEKSTIKQLFEQDWDKMVEEKFSKPEDIRAKEIIDSCRKDLPPINKTQSQYNKIWRLRGKQSIYQLFNKYEEVSKIEAEITKLQQELNPNYFSTQNHEVQTDISAPSTSTGSISFAEEAVRIASEVAAIKPSGLPTGDMCQKKVRHDFRVCIHQQFYEILGSSENVYYDKVKNMWSVHVPHTEIIEPMVNLIDMLNAPHGTMPQFTYFFGNTDDPNASYILHDYCNPKSVNFFLHIKEQKCKKWDGSEHPSCVFVQDPPEESWRREVMSRYLLQNSLLKEKRIRGMDCSDKIPDWYDLTPRMQQLPRDVKEHESHQENVSTLGNWWSKIKENFYSIKWTKWLKRLGMAIVLFTFIGTCMGLFRYFTGSGDKEAVVTAASVGMSSAIATKAISDTALTSDIKSLINAEGHVSGDSKVARQSVKNIAAAVKVINKSGNPSGQLAAGVQEHIRAKFQRNTFFLGVKTDNGVQYPGRCLGVCGQYAIVVSHYIEAWKKACALNDMQMWYIPMIDGRAYSVPLKFNDLKFIEISNSALSLVKLPLSIRAFKDIRKMFLPKDQHKFLNRSGCMFETEYQMDVPAMTIYQIEFKPCHNQKVLGCEVWSDFMIADGYEYTGFSGDGCCGSVLVCSNSQTPIIGMHVAGFPGCSWGYSDLLYREMFDGLGNQPDAVEVLGEGLMSRWYVDAHCIGMGKVPPKFAHMERGKSRIAPSEVQLAKEFPVLTQPAVLSKNDKRIKDNPFSPMTEGCKYHGKPLHRFPEDDIKLVIEDVKRMILAKCKAERKPGLLTVDEACGGFDGKPGYEHLEFKTSEGFPFVGMRPPGATNKRWMFNFDENNKYKSCKPELQAILDLKWKQRLNNQIPATVFTDCLKDCTIPHEKVLIPGKTRIFSMAPVDFTIQQRQCTLDFVVAYMTNRHNLEHMIGCNPDSIEWTLLAKRLLEKGNNIVTGDYSKYGDTLPAELIHGCFEIIREWYKFNDCDNLELQQQLKIMPYEIASSLHLMFDHIYSVVCGQPSGNSLTVIINSMVNSMYVRLAWLEIMRSTKFNSLKDFHQYCIISSYGDDLICSIDDCVKEMFNGITMQKFFENYGLKFTNADKSDNIVKYVPLTEAEFLKRGFVDHPKRKFPQVILAPLQANSIEDTVNWVWEDSYGRNEPGCPTFREMSIQVCQDSIRNAFSRGPEYYQQWSDKIQNFWLKRGEYLKIDTWDQMDYKIFVQEMDLSPYHKWCLNKFVT